MERRQTYRALVVEDDGAILNLVKIVLERENFTVEGVKNGAAAIEVMKSVAYELLIIDLTLPVVSGEEILGFIEKTKPKWLRRVIVTTASPHRFSCDFLEKICRLLVKPFDVEQLILYARECMGTETEAA
jgi:DNA-binding response OmpR family regulator